MPFPVTVKIPQEKKNSKQHIPHILWCRPPVTGAKQIFSGFFVLCGGRILGTAHCSSSAQWKCAFTARSVLCHTVPNRHFQEKILWFTHKICFTIEIWSSARWRPWNIILSNKTCKIMERSANDVVFSRYQSRQSVLFFYFLTQEE